MGLVMRERDEKGRFKKLPMPSKEELKQLYCNEKMNTPKIAKLLGVEKTTILTWMKEYNIPRRRQGESLSPTIKKLWTTSKYREKTTEAIRKKHRSQTMRDKKSKVTKQLWKNLQFKTKLSKIRKKLWEQPEHRIKISKGRKRMWQNPEYRAKMIEERKRRWCDPEYKERVIRKIRKSLAKKPTKPEQNVIELIKKYALPFHYTGDGEVIIDGLNPDFINNNGEKKVIEVFGRAFHDPEFKYNFFEIPWKQQHEGKTLAYMKRGYDCLILWEDEPKSEILEKIREFA